MVTEHLAAHRRQVRVNALAYVLWWFVVGAMVVLVIFDHDDVPLTVARVGAGLILWLALTMFKASRHSLVEARCLRRQAEVACKVLMEATSAYSFGETLVVVAYNHNPETILRLREQIIVLEDVKTVFPAGMPPWLESDSTPP